MKRKHALFLYWRTVIVILCTIIYCLGWHNQVQCQNQCSVATLLTPSETNVYVDYTLPGGEYWFKFAADTNDLVLQIIQNSDTSSLIATITIYSGDC